MPTATASRQQHMQKNMKSEDKQKSVKSEDKQKSVKSEDKREQQIETTETASGHDGGFFPLCQCVVRY